MELKLQPADMSGLSGLVLIVPYGIEIRFVLRQRRWYHRVLIVPYGIEICLSQGVGQRESVLIVPYGIEISSAGTLPIALAVF